MNASDVCSLRCNREIRVVPNPSAFFDILSETDNTARSRKISSIEYQLEDDGNDRRSRLRAGLERYSIYSSLGLASVFAGMDFSTWDKMPLLLRQLAGDIYIPRERLRMLGPLGEGGFAVVQKMELASEDHKTTEIVAVKKLKPGIIEDDQDLKELIEESNVLRKLRHRGIVQFKGIGCLDDTTVESMQESIFLAEEFLSGGTLKSVILNQMRNSVDRDYTMLQAWKWLLQISQALSYLHLCTPSVVHRDVKPENVLMSSRSLQIAVAKIADFGLHKRMNKISKIQRSISTGLLDSSSTHTPVVEKQETQILTDPRSAPLSLQTKKSRETSPFSLDMPSHFRILKKSSSLSLVGYGKESSLDVVPEDSPVNETGYHNLASAFSVPEIFSHNDPSPVRLVSPPDTSDVSPFQITMKEADDETQEQGQVNRGSSASLETVCSEPLHDKKIRRGQYLKLLDADPQDPDNSDKASRPEQDEQKLSQPLASTRSSAVFHFLFQPDKNNMKSLMGAKQEAIVEGELPSEKVEPKSLLESKQHGSSKALDELGDMKAGLPESPEKFKKTRRSFRKLPSGITSSNLALDLSGTNVVSGVVGSLMYMAPEVYKNKSYDEKVDVFGFGCIMYELFSSQLVMFRILAEARRATDFSHLIKKHAKEVAKGYREPIPKDWPEPVQKLIADCWNQKSTLRPCFPDITEALLKLKEDGCIDLMDKKITQEMKKHKMPGCCVGCVLN